MHGSSKKEVASDEWKLIQSVLSGNTNDFEALVLEHQDRILSLIQRQVRNEATARDLAQETFVRAFQNLRRFRGDCLFSTWLTRIALNMTNSYFSSRKFKESQMSDSLQAQHSAIPADKLECIDHVAHLQTLIAALKPKYREVIVLCSLEGKTYEEAAEVLEVPLGTVCSRMNKALEQLRERLHRIRIKEAV